MRLIILTLCRLAAGSRQHPDLRASHPSVAPSGGLPTQPLEDTTRCVTASASVTRSGRRMELTVNPAGPAAGPGTLSEVQAALEAFWSLHDEVPVGVRIEIDGIGMLKNRFE